MSYAAATPDRDANAKPLPDSSADPAVAKLVQLLRDTGVATIRCRYEDEQHAGTVVRFLMNELCEPITVSRVDGGLQFTRERRDCE